MFRRDAIYSPTLVQGGHAGLSSENVRCPDRGRQQKGRLLLDLFGEARKRRGLGVHGLPTAPTVTLSLVSIVCDGSCSLCLMFLLTCWDHASMQRRHRCHSCAENRERVVQSTPNPPRSA